MTILKDIFLIIFILIQTNCDITIWRPPSFWQTEANHPLFRYRTGVIYWTCQNCA